MHALADAVAALPPVLRVAHTLPPAAAPLPSSTPVPAGSAASTPLRFAVIAVGGTQFKVTVNDLITPAKVPVEVGQAMEFTPLMVSRYTPTNTRLICAGRGGGGREGCMYMYLHMI